MKFNWGTGIAIFLILFIGALIWVLYQSRQVDNSLVSDTYYQEDLMYQKKYEKLENYAKLTEKVNTVSYTHLRAHETVLDLVCRLLLEKKNNKKKTR